MDFSNYKFRCHYQGDLVSVPKGLTPNQESTLNDYRERAKGIGRALTDNQEGVWHDLETKLVQSKVYKLSATAKNILTGIVMAERYGRRYSMTNKYFSKGLATEKAGRDLASKLLGQMLIASTERKENDWVTGAIDVEPEDTIFDIKSSYDYTSFTRHLIDEHSEYHQRQLDSYMDLWNKKQSAVLYVLVDTPFNLINDEIRRADWRDDILNVSGEVRDEKIQDVVDLISQHIYSRKALELFTQESSVIHIEWFDDFIEIPEDARLHMVEHEYDKVRIEQRNESLKICREYMNTVKTINKFKKI